MLQQVLGYWSYSFFVFLVRWYLISCMFHSVLVNNIVGVPFEPERYQSGSSTWFSCWASYCVSRMLVKETWPSISVYRLRVLFNAEEAVLKTFFSWGRFWDGSNFMKIACGTVRMCFWKLVYYIRVVCWPILDNSNCVSNP